MNGEIEKAKVTTYGEDPLFSDFSEDIKRFHEYRTSIECKLQRDDYYRVFHSDPWDTNKITDQFNMLHHDGFKFSNAIPVKEGSGEREKNLVLFIFTRIPTPPYGWEASELWKNVKDFDYNTFYGVGSNMKEEKVPTTELVSREDDQTRGSVIESIAKALNIEPNKLKGK